MRTHVYTLNFIYIIHCICVYSRSSAVPPQPDAGRNSTAELSRHNKGRIYERAPPPPHFSLCQRAAAALEQLTYRPPTEDAKEEKLLARMEGQTGCPLLPPCIQFSLDTSKHPALIDSSISHPVVPKHYIRRHVTCIERL